MRPTFYETTKLIYQTAKEASARKLKEEGTYASATSSGFSKTHDQAGGTKTASSLGGPWLQMPQCTAMIRRLPDRGEPA